MKRSIWGILLLLTALSVVACGGGNAENSEPIYDVVQAGSLTAGDPIPVPSGDIVITIEGKISNPNVGETAQFDLETLESIGLVSYDVDDPFAKQQIVYTGVLMSELLDVVGADADATGLELVASNDYSAEAKISDMREWPFLFGLQADGNAIPLDEGGPAIIIIPFDDYPDDLDHVTYDAQWVWSMTRIVVK